MQTTNTPALARTIAAVAVWVYCAGFELGRAVHRASGALAAVWRQLWVPPAVLARPAVHPLAMIADELQMLSCRQLRQVGGIRAKRSKAYLIGAICAA